MVKKGEIVIEFNDYLTMEKIHIRQPSTCRKEGYYLEGDEFALSVYLK